MLIIYYKLWFKTIGNEEISLKNFKNANMSRSCEIVFNRMSDRRPCPIGSVGLKVRRKSDESPPGQPLSGPSSVRLLPQMPDRTRAKFAGLLGSLLAMDSIIMICSWSNSTSFCVGHRRFKTQLRREKKLRFKAALLG